jgi:hypothetical protein
MWQAHMPMHSDIDILIVTENELDVARREALVNETYLLYLECGRQISPQIWSGEARRVVKRQCVSSGLCYSKVKLFGQPMPRLSPNIAFNRTRRYVASFWQATVAARRLT